MKSIDAVALSELIESGANIQLIDVREAAERAEFNIGGRLIPLGEIMQHYGEIDQHKPVVFYCRKGIRSQIAIQRLQEKFSFPNLINLTGGIDAWKRAGGKGFCRGSDMDNAD